MKKTLLYIAVLGVFGFGVWFLLFKNDDAFNTGNAAFTIKDTAAIGKIFLADNSNETIKLERTPKGWMVNDKYRVRQASLAQLMEALEFQEAQTPVSEKMHNNVIKALAGGSVKVEVYNRSGAIMRTFYVGGETNSGKGTFMLIEGASRPYVVQIPGFNGYLTPRYLPELNNWRDRSVFLIEPEQITDISVTYPKEPLNSFVVQKKTDQVAVQIDPALTEGKTLNQKRANDYIGFFKSAYAEQVLNNVAGIRENISMMPLICSITVNGKDDYHQDADIYLTPLTRRSKNLTSDIQDTSGHYDFDHFYVVSNKKQDTLLVQKLIFDKFLRLGYEFYVPDQQNQAFTTERVR